VLAPLLATGSMRADERLVAAVATAALVFPLLGVARLLPWAIAVLASSVLVASEHGDLGSVGLALCAALLLLIERRLARRLVIRIAAETAAAGALAAAVVVAASLGIPAGLATLSLGLVATVSLIALVAVLVARR
jgi:hypothetical protein